MEHLLGLHKLQKELGKLIGIESDGKADDERLKAAILLIYNSAKERIFQVADHVARGIIPPAEDVGIMDDAKEPSLPEKEEWDFHLGDTVRIGVSREDFKWMQKQTIGWRGNLNEVYGQVGIVCNVYCKYENSIGIYFPDVYTACSLYAGTLEKVKPREESKLLSRWKMGDYVRTISSSKVLAMLERGLSQLPDDLEGKRGRVVGVTHPCIIVTFDEKRTLFLKSSALVPCDNKASLSAPEVEHARGFKVGDEVLLISNMKKLIKDQKDKGEWASDMSPIRGEKATVIYVRKDGTLILQTKHCRGWRVSPDSILSAGENETPEEDLDFHPGDIVKVVVPRNVRVILAMAEVPSVFLEFLRVTAEVTLVDDDLDYYIKFNYDQNIQAHTDTLRKATELEKEKHDRIESLVKGLEKGHRVYLDIGPPNFVQAVVSELNASPDVKMALTRSAELVGFVDPYTAVIQYDNGLRCRVKKKYLTVPEKFFMGQTRDTVEPEAIVSIRDKIARSVEDIHSREGAPTEDWKVSVIFMFHGNPPCVEFKVESTVAAYQAVFDWLDQNSGWDVTSLGEGQFMVSGDETSKMEVKVGIIFNDEKSEFLLDVNPSNAEVVSGGHEEGAPAKDKAGPRQPAGTIAEGPRQPPEEKPDVGSVEDFQYLRLYDPALARNVYFPYVIHGQRRTPIEPTGAGGGPRGRGPAVNHIDHIAYFYNN